MEICFTKVLLKDFDNIMSEIEEFTNLRWSTKRSPTKPGKMPVSDFYLIYEEDEMYYKYKKEDTPNGDHVSNREFVDNIMMTHAKKPDEISIEKVQMYCPKKTWYNIKEMHRKHLLNAIDYEEKLYPDSHICRALKLELDNRIQREKEDMALWETTQGFLIPIESLSDAHLANIYLYLQYARKEKVDKYKFAIEGEIINRVSRGASVAVSSDQIASWVVYYQRPVRKKDVKGTFRGIPCTMTITRCDGKKCIKEEEKR
jgi:hypothetical protein